MLVERPTVLIPCCSRRSFHCHGVSDRLKCSFLRGAIRYSVGSEISSAAKVNKGWERVDLL